MYTYVYSISEDPTGTPAGPAAPAVTSSTGSVILAEKRTPSTTAANAIGEADEIGHANGDNDGING